MDELDDFLNSIGLPSTDTTTPQEEPQQTITMPEPEPQNLSRDDFNDILQENGFVEPQYETYEEVTEEEENQVERDLDAEEDADLENRIASGEISLHNEAQMLANNNEDVANNEATVSSNSSEENKEPFIPENSPTLLLDTSTSRFSGTEWYNEIQKQRVILAGIGGIGSWTALQLARMCPALMVLYDDDIVETANMSGQLFSHADIGKHKVDAIADTINQYTSSKNIFAVQEKFTANNCQAGDIMICGFDNMSARRIFFDAWFKHLHDIAPDERKKCLFLDGRLSIDTLQVIAITGDDCYNIERYNREFLFSDHEADETVCSMKQTTYLACMIGSFIVNLFTNFTANLLNPIVPYDLPFFTEYDAQNMIFKTER